MFRRIFLFMLASTSLYAVGEDWPAYKERTFTHMSSITGWCTNEKAALIMDTIKTNRCQTCVEIGVFAGKSLLPIARAIKHNGQGRVHAIDPWSFEEAAKGFKVNDPNYAWWKKQDFEGAFKQTLKMCEKRQLNEITSIHRKTAIAAQNHFPNNTIDFIHFDGNHNEPIPGNEVLAYYPRVKDRGFILLSDCNWLSMRRPLVYLLERCDIISNFSGDSKYLLLRKNPQREKTADKLMNK